MKSALCVLAAAGFVSSAMGQDVTMVFPAPSFDRWMYPFNSTPGVELQSPAFGAILQPGFDDRDSQFLMSFNTSAFAPAGQGVEKYRILSGTLLLVIANDNEVFYDPTPDSVTSLYAQGDPQQTTDADPGRPIELFGAGYRNGWSLSTFLESSRFGGTPIAQPAEGARNVFAATFDPQMNATDISRQVRQRFEATPLAIGTTTSVQPGQRLPLASFIQFNLSPCDSQTRRYLQWSLNEGRLNLIASSLEPASGGPGGGSGDRTYPIFYTRENGGSLPARLILQVRVGNPADFTGDGFVDGFDYDGFVEAFENGNDAADFNQDCFIDGFDYDDFVAAFEQG